MKSFLVTSLILGVAFYSKSWAVCPTTDLFGNWNQTSLNAYARVIRSDLSLGLNSTFNVGRDQINEIMDISVVSKQTTVSGPFKEKMLLLIEPRLLDQKGVNAVLFLLSLQAYQTQLAKEGIDVIALKLKVYGHDFAQNLSFQDGKTLLGIRKLVKQLHQCAEGTQAPVKGSILVGRFPEARIARRIVLPDDSGNFRIRAEVTAGSADIVLADLTGNWDNLYRDNVNLTDVTAEVSSFNPIVRSRGTAKYDFWNRLLILNQAPTSQQKNFKDVFVLPDEFTLRTYSILNINSILVKPLRNLFAEDAQDIFAGRIMATPEIQIARVNAWGTALVPRDPEMMSGERAIKFTSRGEVEGRILQHFNQNVNFELELLARYFFRNVLYRRGAISDSHINRRASLVTGAPEFNIRYYEDKLDLIYGRKDVLAELDQVQFYEWMLKDNSLFKGIIAHSTARSSEFNPHPGVTSSESFEAMNQRLGRESGLPENQGLMEQLLFWSVGDRSFSNRMGVSYSYNPSRFPVNSDGSFRNNDMVVDHLVRYNNYFKKKVVGERAHFYYHGGCEAASPTLSNEAISFTDNLYGKGRPTNSFLFLGEGLAVIGRSKIYFDNMINASSGLEGPNARIGDIFTEYYRQFNTGKLSDAYLPGYHSKSPYFWNLVGDYSLPK
jgi:hypothetical protein